LTATAFRWLLVPELGLGAAGILWAWLAGSDAVVYTFTPSVVLASLGLTLAFVAVNFSLFFAGRRQAFAESVYAFLEEDIFPLVQRATFIELLLGAAMAGFAEELLFRGLLQPRVGLVAASIVFGLLHGPSRSLWPLAAWASGAGFALGLLFETTDNLLIPTLVHAFYDAVALLYVHYYWRPRPADESSVNP
jgi:membrane protease YdiL (CAAX protease family)